ncbi:MAG: hypothetical protein ACYDBQ_01250 [Thermoplasmatota archaeon]
MADDLVALLHQFAHKPRLPTKAALTLLAPMEKAAASKAGRLDPHEAVVRVVRENYVPAILETHVRHGVPLTRILDGIAQTLGAGVVVEEPGGKPAFQPNPACQAVLSDFMGGLLQESTAAATTRHLTTR